MAVSSSSSWLRRVGRSLRVCLASLALLFVWTLPAVVADVMQPLVAGPLLVMVTGAFMYWYWIRPRRFKRRRGPADLRSRALPPGTHRLLASGILLSLIATEAAFILHLRVLPVPKENPFEDLAILAVEPWGWVPVFVQLVVFAPVFEETVFRGWIQRPLERLWGAGAGIIVTAILFSLAHAIPEYVLYYFGMGVLLGGVVVLTRSIRASVLLHAVHNLQSGALLVAGADYDSEIAFAQQTPVVITSAIVLLASGTLLFGVARRLSATARPVRAARVMNAVIGQAHARDAGGTMPSERA
jgi:membrane protease YdiL (CAAX protease family)